MKIVCQPAANINPYENINAIYVWKQLNSANYNTYIKYTFKGVEHIYQHSQIMQVRVKQLIKAGALLKLCLFN